MCTWFLKHWWCWCGFQDVVNIVAQVPDDSTNSRWFDDRFFLQYNWCFKETYLYCAYHKAISVLFSILGVLLERSFWNMFYFGVGFLEQIQATVMFIFPGFMAEVYWTLAWWIGSLTSAFAVFRIEGKFEDCFLHQKNYPDLCLLETTSLSGLHLNGCRLLIFVWYGFDVGMLGWFSIRPDLLLGQNRRYLFWICALFLYESF